MAWGIIIILGWVSPFVLLWGWNAYVHLPDRLDLRSRASLIGLSSPKLSGFVWLFMVGLHTPVDLTQRLITAGQWVAIGGMLISLAGRPRLILATVPACIGTILLWFTTTLP